MAWMLIRAFFGNSNVFFRLTSLEPFGLSEWCGLHIILCLSPGVPLESTVLCVCGLFVHSKSISAMKVYLGRAPAEGTTGYGCFWSLASTGAAHPWLLISWVCECNVQPFVKFYQSILEHHMGKCWNIMSATSIG